VVGEFFWCQAHPGVALGRKPGGSPDNALTVSHWRNGYIVTYALCEALALVWSDLRFTGVNFQQSLPYYIGGFVMLFFFGPREPVSS